MDSTLSNRSSKPVFPCCIHLLFEVASRLQMLPCTAALPTSRPHSAYGVNASNSHSPFAYRPVPQFPTNKMPFLTSGYVRPVLFRYIVLLES